MALYDDMKALARDILTDPDFKQGTAYLIQPGANGAGPAYNPGNATPAVPVELPGAVAKGVSSKYIIRSLAVEGDLQVTSSVVEGVTIDQARDKIRYDGHDWKIVAFMPTPPVGTVVVWKFIIRR